MYNFLQNLYKEVIRFANPTFDVRIVNIFVIMESSGDDRLRRERLFSDCESRGTDLEKSVQKTSANRTNSYAAMPLAA